MASHYERRRERIDEAYKKEQKEYEKKLTDGREKAKELNERFADWYYIISNSEYQKIHLTRTKKM